MAREKKEKVKEEIQEGEFREDGDTRPEGLEAEAQVDEAELLKLLASLKGELADLQVKSEEYLDGWQRERAEFANYKKRMERERDQMKQSVTGDLIRRYLEVLDDLERALKNRPAEGEGAVWAEGIELIFRKLLAILEAEGIERMEVEGQLFDPNMHEAISQEASDEHESGEVIEVIKNGYRLGERILRPAMVRIAQ
jgi:molecular chaperone GrpE